MSQCILALSVAGSRLFGATISARPFRPHLFRCRTFSAQIVSAPIRCYLTFQLFRVSQKAPNIGAEKVRAEMAEPKSRGPICGFVNFWHILYLIHRWTLRTARSPSFFQAKLPSRRFSFWVISKSNQHLWQTISYAKSQCRQTSLRHSNKLRIDLLLLNLTKFWC